MNPQGVGQQQRLVPSQQQKEKRGKADGRRGLLVLLERKSLALWEFKINSPAMR